MRRPPARRRAALGALLKEASAFCRARALALVGMGGMFYGGNTGLGLVHVIIHGLEAVLMRYFKSV